MPLIGMLKHKLKFNDFTSFTFTLFNANSQIEMMERCNLNADLTHTIIVNHTTRAKIKKLKNFIPGLH